MTTPSLWNPTAGRELDATLSSVNGHAGRLVACLNVWNDVHALRRTLPTWHKYVDHVIAVDGAYVGSDEGLSTDGTREFLLSFPNVTLIDAHGLTQCDKRTKYLHAGRDGDMLFIIDADESASNMEHLRASVCDVGWVRVQNDLYSREYGQPRLIKWRPNLSYDMRHHWIFENTTLLCTHQYGGPGYEHRPSLVRIHNQRSLGRTREHMTAKSANRVTQHAAERQEFAMPRSILSDGQTGRREALQIASLTYRDDGLAPSRLHTAINRTTPHSSLFFKSRPGPFGVPEQYSSRTHAAKMAQAIATADVLHYHGVMSAARATRGRTVATVFHHHGTMLRTNANEYNAQARDRNALVLVANLELLSWTEDLDAKFLPNAVPAARYAELARQLCTPFTGSNPFRVAHSPSQPHRKGTEQFLAACTRLMERGVPIEPVVIHGLDHGDALSLKATCHAMFDSFWLGIQCSGVEAAAMKMPVIAGDTTVADRYVGHFGAVPYTFANDGEQLEAILFKMVDDASFRMQEQQRVHQYVIENHDESAVALTYLDFLDRRFGWRDKTAKSAIVSRSVFRGARV